MADFEEIRPRVMPVVVSHENAETSEKSMISQPLVPGLRIAYALDDKRTITYIPPMLFERWNVSIEIPNCCGSPPTSLSAASRLKI